MRVHGRSLLAGLHKAEDWLLVLLVAAMVLLAGAQIVLRQFFDYGLPWADGLLRALVLWTAVFGAMAAARDNKHLAVDAISRLAKGRWAGAVELIGQGFAALISAMLAWYSYRLILLEREYITEAFLGFDTWHLQIVLPLGFAVIALRFGVRAANGIKQMVVPQP